MTPTDIRTKNSSSQVNEERRGFLMTSLATGFALAVQPVTAQTITTDTNGLMAGEVKIPVKDAAGSIPAYHAMPANGNNLPVALVVQEIFGVHEHIKDLCRRLAKAGYLAIAPELYARQGDVSKLSNIQDIFKIVSQVPDSQVMSDLDAAVDWAKSNHGNTNRLAITGFCWGGRIVWLYSAHNKNLKAGAAWYGRLEGDTNAMTPKNPIDLVSQMNAPVLGLYGAKDMGIPVASVEKMRAAMNAAKKPAEIQIYEQAEHGFNADYRPSYNKEAATDAWAKMLAFFKKYGV
jgi:carboxymethylenebutenolidase